jgi:hypothetical protein
LELVTLGLARNVNEDQSTLLSLAFSKEFPMRRWYFGFAAIFALGLVAAFGPGLLPADGPKGGPAAAPKIASSKIAKVTVYFSGALVTREVDVPEGRGLVELVVSPMPEQIDANSVYTEGAEGIRVLTTRYRTRQVLEDTSEERRKLEAEKENLLVTATRIDSEMGSIQKNMELLAKLEHCAEKPSLGGDAIITVTKYVMENRVDKAKDLVVLAEQKRQNNIKMEFCKRKMNELGHGTGREEREAVIVVDREAGKGGKVRLNYLVREVSWRPEYKLRAGMATEEVRVDYMANLKQRSGEDWNHVQMTLSTAQPMLNAAPPELAVLQPVLIARGAPGGPPVGGGATPGPVFAPSEKVMDIEQRNRKQRLEALRNLGYLEAGRSQKDAVKFLNEAAAGEQQLELMKSRGEILADSQKKPSVVADQARNDGPSVTYHLANALTVPSRNDDQIIEVAKLSLTPRYYYKAVPVLNRHVYRLADLVNKSSHILLPGEATMYQGTDFVGRMPMPQVAVGEEFTAGFGVDPQLQIQRQLVDKDRTMKGGNQVLKYEFRILVSSYKSEPVKLQVWDRLPHAEAESVGISIVKTAPELSKDALYLRECRPNNLLRWDLDVEPGVSGEKAMAITYEFRMELDRQMAITGFQSR